MRFRGLGLGCQVSHVPAAAVIRHFPRLRISESDRAAVRRTKLAAPAQRTQRRRSSVPASNVGHDRLQSTIIDGAARFARRGRDDELPHEPAAFARLTSLSESLMQNQFLHAPIGGFGGVDFVLRRASKPMRAGELLELAPGAADDAEHFAVERNFEDAARGKWSRRRRALDWGRA